MRSTLIIGLIVALGFPLIAQDQTGEIENAEFIVEKEKDLVLPPASRKYSQFNFQSIKPEPAKLEYNIREPLMEVAPFNPDLNASLLEKRESPSHYNNSVKLGFGNLNSPLAQIMHHSHRNETMDLGLRFFHESFGKGPVRKKQSGQSQTEIGANVVFRGDKINFLPDLSYGRESFYFYGLSNEAFANDSINIYRGKVRQNRFAIQLPIEGSITKDKWYFSINPFWQFVNQESSFVFNKENNGGGSLEIWSKGKGIQPGIIFSGKFSSYQSGAETRRSWYTVNPYFSYGDDRISVNAGLEFGFYEDSINQNDIYVVPDVLLNFEFSDRLTLQSKLTGGAQRNTISSISIMNPFLQDSIDLKTTINRFSLEAGLEAILLPDLSVSVSGTLASVRNQLYIINSIVDSSRFELLYEPDPISIYGLNMGLDYGMTEMLNVFADLEINKYNSKLFDRQIHLPSIKLQLGTVFTLFKRMHINPSFHLLDDITAVDSSGESFDLPTVIDLSVSGKYQLNTQGMVFLSLGNLLNRQNQRYLYYNVRQFTLKAGFSYHF